MKISGQLLLSGLVIVALLAGILLGYYEMTGGMKVSSSSSSFFSTNATSSEPSIVTTGSVTGTSAATTASDTFFTLSCSITGIGGFSLLVVSDSTGVPVSGETVNAVDRLGCGSMPQVVYLDNFTVGQGGWLTPVFPPQATPGGGLDFTVTYEGRTYNFAANVPPIGFNCVTLHVPSGSVTTQNVMNGYGSYCFQGSTTAK